MYILMKLSTSLKQEILVYNTKRMAVVSPVTFLKEARSELTKVIWPTRAETLKLTALVIGISATVGLFIGGLDILFVTLQQYLIK